MSWLINADSFQQMNPSETAKTNNINKTNITTSQSRPLPLPRAGTSLGPTIYKRFRKYSVNLDLWFPLIWFWIFIKWRQFAKWNLINLYQFLSFKWKKWTSQMKAISKSDISDKLTSPNKDSNLFSQIGWNQKSEFPLQLF